MLGKADWKTADSSALMSTRRCADAEARRVDKCTDAILSALFIPGPQHLFWSTGVCYLSQLGGKYAITMVIDESYTEEDIEKSRTLSPGISVVTINSKNSLRRHIQLKRLFLQYFRSNQPSLTLVHHDSTVESQYCLHYLRKYSTDKNTVIYQSAKLSLDYQLDRQSALLHQVALIQQSRFVKHIRVPHAAIKTTISLRNIISSLINYKILPTVLVGKPFSPPQDNIRGKISRALYRQNKNLRYFMYYENEKRTFEEWGARNVELVPHPVKEEAEKLKLRFGIQHDYTTISIFPTYGANEQLMWETALSESDIIRKVAEGWSEAIRCVRKCYDREKIRVLLKLHKASENDRMWRKIIAKIREKETLEIVDASHPALTLILGSKAVLSDYSSVLWLASLAGKPSICLDIFGYREAQFMRNYEPNISVVKNVRQIREILATQHNFKGSSQGLLVKSPEKVEVRN
jgi:hypothetical protein